ncbi:MAG: hypothetical protein QGG36_08520 [Pirellulaceae bacterium]|jgi:hypothetical protein|nr:hypothetical protein [Pirellulaceae bacterium]
MTDDLELDIQRLVDRELTAPQREVLLAQLDVDGNQWREVALAFVEEQLIAQAVQANAGATEKLGLGKATAGGEESSDCGGEESSDCGVENPDLDSSDQRERTNEDRATVRFVSGTATDRQSAMISTAGAIALAIATFVVGYQLGLRPETQAGPTIANEEPNRAIEHTRVEPTVELASQLAAADKRLREAGYRLETESVMLEADMGDGLWVVEPWHTISVSYDGQ